MALLTLGASNLTVQFCGSRRTFLDGALASSGVERMPPDVAKPGNVTSFEIRFIRQVRRSSGDDERFPPNDGGGS